MQWVLQFFSSHTVSYITNFQNLDTLTKSDRRVNSSVKLTINFHIPGACFSKIPKLFRPNFGPISGVTIPFFCSFAAVLSHQTSQSSWFFSHLKQVKRWVFKTSGLQFQNWLFGPEHLSGRSRNRPQGPVSRKSRELFGPEKLFVKLRPAYSVKLVFSYIVKGIKIKITAKFRASKRLRFEDTKKIMSPEIRPKSFGTFEKRAPSLA